METTTGEIRVGIGGWDFKGWRGGAFYPVGLKHAKELEYASRQLTAIEVNGTYYGPQKPESFARWRDDSPEGFVFALKAPQLVTASRKLAEMGGLIHRFLEVGPPELGPKLGPILWQFPRFKSFHADDFEGFLQLLPEDTAGLPLHHVLDVRHESFLCAEFLALARKYGMATVFTDSDEYPSFADVTGDIVYARLMNAREAEPLGYKADELDTWTARAKLWAGGGEPSELPRIESLQSKGEKKPRDVYVFAINGAKERAPAAAMALLDRLGKRPATAITPPPPPPDQGSLF